MKMQVPGIFVFSFVLFLSGTLSAGDKPPASSNPIAPVPAQIVSAKKVFISNACGQEQVPGGFATRDSDPAFAYNSFYDAVSKSGRYEPVLAPADADLVLEIRFGYPIENTHHDVSNPRLLLNIFDPKTHVLLWAFSQEVKTQGGPHYTEKNAKNLDAADSALVQKLVNLASRSASASP